MRQLLFKNIKAIDNTELDTGCKLQNLKLSCRVNSTSGAS